MKEEKIRRCRPDAGGSERREVGQVVGVSRLRRTRTNSTRTAILISTMIALARADSLAPRMSSSMRRNTSTTAG
jgi:hypothetical protein